LTVISHLTSLIESIEKDKSIYYPRNFERRADKIDELDFHILDHIKTSIWDKGSQEDLSLLKLREERLKLSLEEIDDKLFHKLRERLLLGEYRQEEFRKLLAKYLDLNAGHFSVAAPVYDNLDTFINRLLCFDHVPQQQAVLEPEMIYYQKTPARVVLEIAKRCIFSPEDVFVDIGSGLGQTSMLINLLSGIKSVGIEFDLAFCDYAKVRASKLNMPKVTFIHADARRANYANGTVFYLFTPFRGSVLRDVLASLQKQSNSRKIRLITYGPCTEGVAREGWLYSTIPDVTDVYCPAFFESF